MLDNYTYEYHRETICENIFTNIGFKLILFFKRDNGEYLYHALFHPTPLHLPLNVGYVQHSNRSFTSYGTPRAVQRQETKHPQIDTGFYLYYRNKAEIKIPMSPRIICLLGLTPDATQTVVECSPDEKLKTAVRKNLDQADYYFYSVSSDSNLRTFLYQSARKVFSHSENQNYKKQVELLPNDLTCKKEIFKNLAELL